MKTKKVLSGLLAFGLAVMPGVSFAAFGGLIGGADGVNYTLVTATASQVNIGPCTIYGLELSTGDGLSSTVVVDTVAISAGNFISNPSNAVWNGQRVSVQMVHVGTTVVAGSGSGFQTFTFPNPVRLRTGLAIFDGPQVGTQGTQVGVYWK